MDDKTVRSLTVEELKIALFEEVLNLQRLTDNPQPFKKILNDTCIAVQRVTFRIAYPPGDLDDDDEE